jgi:hypothetical protein
MFGGYQKSKIAEFTKNKILEQKVYSDNSIIRISRKPSKYSNIRLFYLSWKL